MTKSLALAAAVVVTAVTSGACHREHPVQRKTTASWHSVGTWSGHGNAQTDSFDVGYTQIRVRWETRNEQPVGAGTFHVTLNSAVSGRELATAVDYKGIGHDVAYVGADPHWSYLLIESSNVDWSVTVEEPALTEGP